MSLSYQFKSISQTASRSVQPFCAVHSCDVQRHADRPRYNGSNRPHPPAIHAIQPNDTVGSKSKFYLSVHHYFELASESLYRNDVSPSVMYDF